MTHGMLNAPAATNGRWRFGDTCCGLNIVQLVALHCTRAAVLRICDTHSDKRFAENDNYVSQTSNGCRWLFGDYMGSGLNTVLLFAPAVDPRISVKAKLGEGEAGVLHMRSWILDLASWILDLAC
jgi:hypothetical protein